MRTIGQTIVVRITENKIGSVETRNSIRRKTTVKAQAVPLSANDNLVIDTGRNSYQIAINGDGTPVIIPNLPLR